MKSTTITLPGVEYIEINFVEAVSEDVEVTIKFFKTHVRVLTRKEIKLLIPREQRDNIAEFLRLPENQLGQLTFEETVDSFRKMNKVLQNR